MEKKIGIIGAMSVEVDTLKSVLKPMPDRESPSVTQAGGMNFYEGLLNGVPVVVVRSGVGKVNAALCAQRLILQFGVTHIVNTGIAGAMASGLGVLDFVCGTDALYHDMDATGFGYKITQIPQMEVSDFPADKKMMDAASLAFKRLKEAEGHKMIFGRIASGDQFISDAEVKARIKENCAPACVEMEGAAIAHAAHVSGIPFLIIRCMSDMADDCGESTYCFNEENAASLSAALVKEILTEI